MYSISEELRELAARAIREHDDVRQLDTPECSIVYLYCDKGKQRGKRAVYADTQKVSDKIKALVGCDFIITFYKPNSDQLKEEQKEILMYHELRHVGFDEETGKKYIIPHDVEDFADIIIQHGVGWAEDA